MILPEQYRLTGKPGDAEGQFKIPHEGVNLIVDVANRRVYGHLCEKVIIAVEHDHRAPTPHDIRFINELFKLPPLYELIYNEVYKELLENPDGTINKDRLMRELADYIVLMENASQVYQHILQKRIAQPASLHASTIIGIYEKRLLKICEDYHQSKIVPKH